MTKVDNRNWKKRFFETAPILDESGKPLPDNPKLNSGFSLVKKSTAGNFSDEIRSTQEKRDRQRRS